MIIIEDIPPAAAVSRDARRATHDGFIWPVCRPDMRDPAACIDRMADDALALFDEAGEITKTALKRLGWTWAQIARHADAAQEDFVRRLAARNRRGDRASDAGGHQRAA